MRFIFFVNFFNTFIFKKNYFKLILKLSLIFVFIFIWIQYLYIYVYAFDGATYNLATQVYGFDVFYIFKYDLFNKLHFKRVTYGSFLVDEAISSNESRPVYIYPWNLQFMIIKYTYFYNGEGVLEIQHHDIQKFLYRVQWQEIVFGFYFIFTTLFCNYGMCYFAMEKFIVYNLISGFNGDIPLDISYVF